MGMDMGMGLLKDKDKDRDKAKAKEMDHRLYQDRDRDASIESCPSSIEIDREGNLRKLLCTCQSLSHSFSP